jgi:hypothetical protein
MEKTKTFKVSLKLKLRGTATNKQIESFLMKLLKDYFIEGEVKVK